MYEPTSELSARVIDAIAEVAAAELCRVAQVIPASPAAEFGGWPNRSLIRAEAA